MGRSEAAVLQAWKKGERTADEIAEIAKIDALESMQLCIDKYKNTGNREYLCDAANYIMFEFMYPQKDGAYFRATDSGESAGISGVSVREMGKSNGNID